MDAEVSMLAHTELGKVATIERSLIQPESIVPGTKYLGLEHIESGGRIIGAQTVSYGDLASSKFRFSGKHLLYGKLRPYLAKIALPDFEGVCSTDILPVLPGPDLDRRYLCYILRQQSMVDLANARASGANLPRISPSEFAKLPISLPPLAEQKRIAAILDAADALRAKRREALAQLDTLLQATFLDMFGDPVTNPKGWEIKTLAESGAKTKVGPFGSLLHTYDYIVGGIPLINPKHMVDGKIVHGGDETVSEEKASELQDYRLKVGDLLVARRGEMGRCLIINKECSGWLCGTGSFYIRVNATVMLTDFLRACISSRPMRSFLDHLSGGAIMPSLSGMQIRNLKVPIPPLNFQSDFVRVSNLIEEQQKYQTNYLAELDTLFASIQSRALRGEL